MKATKTLAVLLAVGLFLGLAGVARATVVLPSGDPDPAHATLKLWMSADTDVFSDAGTTPATNGGAVLQWNNRSTAGGAGSNATSGNSPTFHTTGGIGGQPVVRFNGSNQYFNGSVSIGGPKTFFLVMDAAASGTCCSGGIATRTSGSNNFNGLEVVKSGMDTKFFADRSGAGLTGNAVITNTPTIGALTYETTGTKIYVNGPTVDAFNGSNYTFTGTSYQIATRNNQLSRYLNGDIAELLVYNQVLTLDEINEVGFYLGDKYSITNTFVLPPPPPPPPVLGPNLVLDGSFEVNTNSSTGGSQGSELGASNYAGSTWGGTDVLTYWDKSGTRTWYMTDGGATRFPDGDFAFRVDSHPLEGVNWLYQDGISLTAGTQYQLSFQMWGETSAPWIDVELTNGPTTIKPFNDEPSVGNDGVAELKSIMFTPTVTGIYRLRFSADNPARPNHHTWIDDVKIQAVQTAVIPEPVTMAALFAGIAGLGGYIRRRKRA